MIIDHVRRLPPYPVNFQPHTESLDTLSLTKVQENAQKLKPMPFLCAFSEYNDSKGKKVTENVGLPTAQAGLPTAQAGLFVDNSERPRHGGEEKYREREEHRETLEHERAPQTPLVRLSKPFPGEKKHKRGKCAGADGPEG